MELHHLQYFSVDYISEFQLEREAAIFLAEYHPKYNEETNPRVPIEEIVESRIGINIVPFTGLMSKYQVDGISYFDNNLSKCKIYIDEKYFHIGENGNRARYTIAHELGHILLHRGVYEALRSDDNDEFITKYNSMNESVRKRIETQANKFASYLLIPEKALLFHFKKFIHESSVSISEALQTETDEKAGSIAVVDYVSQHIADLFEVSSLAMRLAITNRGLTKMIQDVLPSFSYKNELL